MSLDLSSMEQRRWLGNRTLLVLLALEAGVLVLGVVFPKPTLLALGILVAAACFVLFFPSRPEWFFYLVIVTSGLDYFGIIATSQTYNVTYFQFALLLAIASYVAYAAMNQQWDLPGTRASMPFLALWGMAAFSLLYCASWQDGVVLVIRILFLGILSFLTVLVVRTKPKMAQTVFFLLATAVVVSVMATYQLVMDKEFLPPELANQFGHGVNRAEGTFANANWMAAFVMIGPVLSLSFLVNLRMPLWKKMIVAGVAASCVLGLLASFSRSGWLSTAIGIGLVPFLSGKFKAYLRFIPLVPLSGLLLFWMFPHVELFSSRLRSFLELGASNASRVCLAISGLWMFRDHPLFGVGIGSFSTVYERSYVHPAMPVVQITKSHTLPVQVLAELGIIGFLLLVWFCYAIIREGLLAIKDIRDPYLRALEVGLVAVFLALMVNSLFNNHLGDNFLWVTIGLIFATRRADRYESLRSRESRQPRCPCAPGGLRVAARRTPQDAA